jgi:hypothetical protein
MNINHFYVETVLMLKSKINLGISRFLYSDLCIDNLCILCIKSHHNPYYLLITFSNMQSVARITTLNKAKNTRRIILVSIFLSASFFVLLKLCHMFYDHLSGKKRCLSIEITRSFIRAV